MRVLIVSNMYPSSEHPAYGGFVLEQVEALRGCGIEIDLAVIRDRKKGLKANLRKYLGLMVSLIGSMSKRYDVIHAHYLFPTGFLALPFALLTKTPLVLTAHGGDIRLGKKAPFKLLTRMTIRLAAKVIAVSEALAEEIKNSFSVPADKVMVASCGVDRKLFYPRDRAECRAKLGIPVEKKVILFVGNLVAVKGVSSLLAAVARVAEAEPLVALILVGEGPLREELIAQAERLGIAERCQWWQPVKHEKIPEMMSAADILVLPSQHEGFGLVALEAHACGLPVVAANVGGLPEIVADHRTGFLVEPGDVDGLLAGIKKLLAAEELRRSMGEAAQLAAKKHCRLEQIDKVKRLYALLKRKK